MYILVNKYRYRRIFSICDYETNLILENRVEKTIQDFLAKHYIRNKVQYKFLIS